jgi:hypothetical protein
LRLRVLHTRTNPDTEPIESGPTETQVIAVTETAAMASALVFPDPPHALVAPSGNTSRQGSEPGICATKPFGYRIMLINLIGIALDARP